MQGHERLRGRFDRLSPPADRLQLRAIERSCHPAPARRGQELQPGLGVIACIPMVQFFVPPSSISPRRSPVPGGDEAALCARVCAGDRSALALLYQRESGPVYRYALALCQNPAWAADAAQEAFAAFATRPQGFNPERGALGAYLAGIARHALLAAWNRAQGHSPLDEAPEEELGAAAAESSEAVLVRQQETRALWTALGRLPFAFREAVVLVDIQERAYAEAAQIAGIELNTLRTRVHRGRAKLAALLNAPTPTTPDARSGGAAVGAARAAHAPTQQAAPVADPLAAPNLPSKNRR
jgi:RNA polymerase sigma-70 factor, ECF subfamily